MARSRPKTLTEAQALRAIEKHGILLTFPIDNRPQPDSLWSAHYPDKMRWEWDETGDDRVAQLWHLRTQLSESRKVVYAKWYQGRATFFSRKVFAQMLAVLGTSRHDNAMSVPGLLPEARQILELLEMNSPQSTKMIKAAADLRGQFFERTYERSMKQLWAGLRIVGFGEFEDGAFPSLGIGATHTLFEDLWAESKKIDPVQALDSIEEVLGPTSLFLKHLLKVSRSFSNSTGLER
jgi:hypothetical protein